MGKRSEQNEPVAARAARITPMNDQVLLRRFESPDKTEGGIVIPAIARERQQRAHVVAVGPGKHMESGERAVPQVRPGDVVLVDEWDGVDVILDGVKHVMLREEKILAVVERAS